MFKNKFIKKLTLCTIALLAIFSAQSIFAQTTAFTYQGKLSDGGNPANTNYDMQFRLFDMAGAGQGTQQGATITNPTVVVTNGNFAVSLDFGAAVFASGADRFLEISLRPAGTTGGYTSLAPRQKLTSAPYSIRSVNANSADSLSTACVGCVQNSNINSVAGSKITGTVANATNAVNATNATNATTATNAITAGNISGIVAIANGGTGSATQNFVDLSTDQAINGNKTFNGAVSAGALSGDGSALTNVFQIQRFGGNIGNIPVGSLRFIGSTTTVTVNGSQRVTGSAVAVLGQTSTVSRSIFVSLCYQNTSGGSLNTFTQGGELLSVVTNNRSNFAVSETTVPAAGEYNIGYCISNPFSTTFSDNGSVQGWVMITNN